MAAPKTVPSPTSSTTNPSAAPVPATDQAIELTLDVAKRLEGRLKYIRNEELCVPKIQELFDSMDFVSRPRNDEEQLQKMTTRLEGKLKRALSAVENLELIAYNTATKLSLQTETVVYPCPSRNPKVRKMPPISYNRNQIEIVNNNRAVPVIVEDDFGGQFYKQLKGLQYSSGGNGRTQGSTPGMTATTSGTPLNFKRQYLLSPHDNAIDNSCPFYFDTRSLRWVFFIQLLTQLWTHVRLWLFNVFFLLFRNIFVSSIRNKRVLILLDHGNSLNVDQLELTKSMGKWMMVYF